MELLTYFFTSLFLVPFFFPGLRRYDGPSMPYRIMNDFSFGSGSFTENEQSMHMLSMRRMLTGSLLRAGFLIAGWVGTGFFLGIIKIDGILPALLFAFPWGIGLAVALYNILKWFRRPKNDQSKG